MKKIACLFPGVIYTFDRPLLYYSWKLLDGLGWEIIPVRYGGFSPCAKKDIGMIIKSAGMALEQSEEALCGIDWSAYGDILMIGKSIGTIAGSAYARRHGINCRQIHFSPVEETFRYAGEKGIVFHGTADRWVDTKVVESSCAEKGLSLYKIEGANHSLETGDVGFDIETIKKTIGIIREYVLDRLFDNPETPLVGDRKMW